MRAELREIIAEAWRSPFEKAKYNEFYPDGKKKIDKYVDDIMKLVKDKKKKINKPQG